MRVTLLSAITEVETIAINRGIREVARLRKQYGRGRWRKRKGVATVLLADGTARTAELHWYEATGIGPKEYKIKRFLDEPMTQLTATAPRFAICIANTDYPAALEVRKIYQVLPDADAAQHQYLRIIDESGEDYLYPAAYFVPIDLPQGVQEALLKAA